MTRKSERELEHAVVDLESEHGAGEDGRVPIVHQDSETGEWTLPGGEPVDREDVDPVMVIVMTETVHKMPYSAQEGER